jgi:ABC-type sugar transport system substrate-binding protein
MLDDGAAALELEESLLSAHDARRLAALKRSLNDFQSVMVKLQFHDITLAQARKLFDALIQKYPSMGGHIGVDADIVHSTEFERALIKLSNGEGLNAEETEAVRPLVIEVSD